MKVILITVLLFQGSFSFLYRKENRYSNFIRKHSDISLPDTSSGLNLKVTDESVEDLVKKLVDQVGSENGIDKSLFDFHQANSDEFEDVDLTEWEHDKDSKEADKEPIDFSDEGVTVSSSYGKWSCAYSRVLSVSENGTKSFWKAHETAKEGGKGTTDVKGALATGITMKTSANADTAVNTTVFYEGKEYKTKAKVSSTVSQTGNEKQAGKKDGKIVDTSDTSISSTVVFGNKSFSITTDVKSGAETFVAPFRIFLTLFESDWEVGVGSTKVKGTVRGEVTSRVVFSKNGKSLTKSTLRGYVLSEGDSYCSVKMFKVKSHIWTKAVAKAVEEDDNSEGSSSDDEVDADIVIDVMTHSKGKVFGRVAAGKKAKIFSGSGVAAFEKARISLPRTVGHDQHGVHWMVKNILDRKLPSWSNPNMDHVGF